MEVVKLGFGWSSQSKFAFDVFLMELLELVLPPSAVRRLGPEALQVAICQLLKWCFGSHLVMGVTGRQICVPDGFAFRFFSGLRGPRTHKSSLSITEQNVTAQTPNPPKTETLVGLLGLSALGKDDHVLEAMSMFPAVPSLPEL
ncbi:hypothetical protein J1605_021201 [Eschrichtius robustus]|uniref:Uncharacterized protein n=1 Tax=Eschrichtius robustus TaxID=9764 RepID=A0AB34HEV9_ESCRO|nr:hypothetical protein J1605_021201 [Eschrichtius robustus]